MLVYKNFNRYIMKRFSKAIIALFLPLAITVTSCKKMDDIYKDFVKDGETVYVGKADSVFIRGGYNRVEVGWLLLSDPKVASYKLFWNNGRDSVSGTVTKTQQVDTVRVLLDNMREGTHHFTIRMYDKNGNSSIPTNASGPVYGPQYEQTLLDRTYRGMVRVGRVDLEVDWTPAEESMVGMEVNYINRAGVEETHWVSNLLNTYVFPGFPENGTFNYRTFFLPDTLALDTFHTDFLPVKVDDGLLGGRNLSFTTEARYGTPPDQLSVWVSTDFDGVYDLANVEAATWREVTDEFMLPVASDEVTPGGPIDLWKLMGDDDEKIYVAFKYVYDPSNASESSGINWRVQDFEVRTNAGSRILNQEEAQFQIVNKGPLEDGRVSNSPTLLLLRSNSKDKVSPTTFWAISTAIE